MLTMDRIRRALRWVWTPGSPEPEPLDFIATYEMMRRRSDLLTEHARWLVGNMQAQWYADYDDKILAGIRVDWMLWEAVTWPWPWTARDMQNLHEMISSLPAYGTIHVRD